MDRANNQGSSDKQLPLNEDELASPSEDVSGSYYYDDTTGYEVYRDEIEETAADTSEIDEQN